MARIIASEICRTVPCPERAARPPTLTRTGRAGSPIHSGRGARPVPRLEQAARPPALTHTGRAGSSISSEGSEARPVRFIPDTARGVLTPRFTRTWACWLLNIVREEQGTPRAVFGVQTACAITANRWQAAATTTTLTLRSMPRSQTLRQTALTLTNLPYR